MQLGLVGLGKMGFNMRDRLRAHGHEVIGYDPRPEVTDVESLAALAGALQAPRVVWVMVPSGTVTRETITALATVLDDGDLVIDGGNSRFTEDKIHADLLAEHGIGYLDCGVSGGIWGLENGYGLMVGGSGEDVARVMPIFDALRPEGERAEDLVTDVHGVLRAWTKGTVVRSWLLDLLVKALDEDPNFAEISGYTEDSGEGRWTVEEAINHAVPAPVISAALFARFASRQSDSPAMKAVSALRNQFGGHAVQRVSESG
jgi:6-phosphogluconate dehydrogenase